MHFSHIIFSNENLDKNRKTLATSYPIRSHKGDLFNDVVRILFCFIYYYGARVHDCRGLGGHTCTAHVEVGEGRHEVGSLLPPLRGLQGFNSDHQARVF